MFQASQKLTKNMYISLMTFESVFNFLSNTKSNIFCSFKVLFKSFLPTWFILKESSTSNRKSTLFNTFFNRKWVFLQCVSVASNFPDFQDVQQAYFRSLRHVYAAILCRKMFARSSFIHLLLSSVHSSLHLQATIKADHKYLIMRLVYFWSLKSRCVQRNTFLIFLLLSRLEGVLSVSGVLHGQDSPKHDDQPGAAERLRWSHLPGHTYVHRTQMRQQTLSFSFF